VRGKEPTMNEYSMIIGVDLGDKKSHLKLLQGACQ